MEKTLPRNNASHISLLFGFDSCIQKSILECLEPYPKTLFIWCGGSPEEAFRVKDWWLREVENAGKCEANLVMGGVKQEMPFAMSFMECLARNRPDNSFCVSVLAPSEGNFGHKTALRFRIGRLLSKLENVPNVSIEGAERTV